MGTAIKKEQHFECRSFQLTHREGVRRKTVTTHRLKTSSNSRTREGCDSPTSVIKLKNLTLQLTPPRWGDGVAYFIAYSAWRALTHAPARGATKTWHRLLKNTASYNSRSPAESDVCSRPAQPVFASFNSCSPAESDSACLRSAIIAAALTHAILRRATIGIIR